MLSLQVKFPMIFTEIGTKNTVVGACVNFMHFTDKLVDFPSIIGTLHLVSA